MNVSFASAIMIATKAIRLIRSKLQRRCAYAADTSATMIKWMLNITGSVSTFSLSIVMCAVYFPRIFIKLILQMNPHDVSGISSFLSACDAFVCIQHFHGKADKTRHISLSVNGWMKIYIICRKYSLVFTWKRWCANRDTTLSTSDYVMQMSDNKADDN